MARALPWRAILASLTTSPATFFHFPERGRLAPGLRADLVVLDRAGGLVCQGTSATLPAPEN